MTHRRPFLIAVAVLLAALPVLPVRPAAASDQRNAATWYRRAFPHLEALTDADWEQIHAYRAQPGSTPPAAVREALAKAAVAMDFARRAAEQSYADYDLDYSQGFELLLPHIAGVRNLARLLQTDALVRLHDGDTAGAASRMGAMYRIAEHSAHDRILIGSLVGRAIFNEADATVQRALDGASFGADESVTLLKSLRRLESDDPFQFLESVVGEQELAVSWLEANFATEAQRQALGEDHWISNDNEQAKALADLDDASFAEAVGGYDRMMDDVIDAFAIADREAGRAAMAAIEDRVSAGGYGPVAQVVAPAFSKVFNLMAGMPEAIAARKAVLEGLVAGRIKPMDEANAAVFYMRAVELLRGVEPAALAAVFAFADGGAGPADETVTAALRDAHEALELAAAGADIVRCDFAAYRGAHVGGELCPAYVAGMHDLARVLAADARHRSARDAAAGRARLVTCYRIVAHLGLDPHLLTPVVAHTTFLRTNALAAIALADDGSGGETRALLLDAAERIGRSDPFGYRASLNAARTRLAALAERPELDAATRAARRDAARAASGDEALYVVAALDAIARRHAHPAAHPAALPAAPPAAGPAAPRPDPIGRMSDLVSAAAIGQVRADAPQLEPRLERGAIDVVFTGDVPVIAHLADRMRDARRDLRQGIMTLRPPRARPPWPTDR